MKKIIVLIISILSITAITYSINFFPNPTSMLKVLLNTLNASIAIIAMKLTKMKLDIDFKNKKQYVMGLIIGVLLSLCIVIIPILLGVQIVGSHLEFNWAILINKLLFYMLIIGPFEELIFRVYIQDTCIGFFKYNKWVGIILSSILFGAVHLINGSLMQMIFATGIGLIFGLCKYNIKDCKYLSLAIAHGIYDFSTIIARMFLI